MAVNLILGDCGEKLAEIKSNSINLIFTSPPYGNQRKKTYKSVHPGKYVDWFLPISEELLRVLDPTGTFILNIKESVIKGERHTYVINLILEMRKQGWLWTEEFIWYKKTCYPGKWPNRFRDSWERLLQFNKNRKFNMYQEKVMIPIGKWAKKRLNKLSDKDKIRMNPKTGSGMGRNVSNWLNRQKVYPTNVLCFSPETENKGHGAVFPKELPKWFIKLFTKSQDLVLDPFAGSGTTLIASQELNRHSIGIEINREYYEKMKEKFDSSIDIFENNLSIN